MLEEEEERLKQYLNPYDIDDKCDLEIIRKATVMTCLVTSHKRVKYKKPLKLEFFAYCRCSKIWAGGKIVLNMNAHF